MGNNSEHKVTPLWMSWVCPRMGLILYHYASIHGLLCPSESVQGDRRYPGKPFRWDKFRLNLPVDLDYSPTLSLMSKVRWETQELAADFTTYVDGSRVAARSAEEACSVDQIVDYICHYLGLQDVELKRSMKGQKGIPWRIPKVYTKEG